MNLQNNAKVTTPRVDICVARLEIDSNRKISATQLRGFFGHLFINDPEFHHHSESPFHYPLVQYKIISDKLSIVGINEYSFNVFRKIPQIEYLVLPCEKVKIVNVELSMQSAEIKKGNNMRKYKFLSPWIALNESNYLRYKNLNDEDYRKQFLERVFIGNILSALKGMNIHIEFQIKASIEKYRSVSIVAHSNRFQAFFALINTNISIPAHIGLGKSVSKGFGTLEEVASFC
jgi:Cas6b C-terminal domain